MRALAHAFLALLLIAPLAAVDTVSVQITGSQLVGEPGEPNAGPIQLEFDRTGNSGNLTVVYSVAGSGTSDVSGATGTVTFPAGSFFIDAQFAVIDDLSPEGDEQVIVTIEPDVAYDIDTSFGSATAAISESDGWGPAVSLGSFRPDAAEIADDDDWFRFTAPSTGRFAIQVRSVSSGSGTANSGYFNLYQANRTTYITGASWGSTYDAASVADLTGGSLYWIRVYSYTEGTYQVGVDTAQALTLSASSTQVTEGGTLTLQVNADRAASRDKQIFFTFGGTATPANGDISDPSGTTLAAGSISKAVSVSITDDGQLEGYETATVNIAPSSDYQVSYSPVTITVSDPGGKTFFVDADATGAGTGLSWTDAATSLTTVLPVAVSGDAIWVAEGLYVPTTTTNRSAFFDIPRGVSMYGGFTGIETALSQRDPEAHPTILSGDIGVLGDASDNSNQIVRMVAPGATIDGFTIRDANGNSYGAGLYISAGGCVVNQCRISGNTGYSGGGLYVESGSQVTISRCRVIGNTAQGYGGGIYSYSNSLQLTNSVIAGNSATSASTYGGGIYAAYGTQTIGNCTIAGNSGTNQGGVYLYYGATMINSVIWGNTTTTGPSFYFYTTPTFSIVEGSVFGGSVLSLDPLFVNAASGDYRIGAGSPAIDFADTPSAPSIDLEARPRAGAGPDLGAFEFNGGTPVVDTTPPVVTFTVPASDPLIVTTASLAISGTSSDDQSLLTTSYELSGATTANAVFADPAAWSVTLNLQPGLNVLRVTSLDSSGNRTIQSRTLDYRRVSVSAPDLIADESGSDQGAIRITRTGDLSQALTVQLVVSGTAIPGLDYPSLPVSVILPAGTSSVDLVVSPVDDGLDEDDESVIVTAQAAAGYGLGTASATVWIAEVARQLTVNAGPLSGIIDHGQDEDWYVFTLPNTADITVEMRGSPTGEGTIGDPYLYLYGPDKKTTLIAQDDDAGVGYNSLINRTLAPGIYYLKASRFGSNTGTYVVEAHFQPTTVSVVGTDLNGDEGGDTATLTVNRAGDKSAPLTVLYSVTGTSTATSGIDYQALTGSLQIPAGANSATIVITPIADALIEGNETVIVALQSSADYQIGSPTTQTVTINEVGGRTIFVRTGAGGANTGNTWTDAFIDLNTALLRTAAGDEVWVSAGTYYPSTSDASQYFQVGSQVSVLGGFPATGSPALSDRDSRTHLTILSGNIGDPALVTDNSYRVVYIYNTVYSSIDGFIIESGRQRGVEANSVQSLTIANTTLRNNGDGSSYGAGLYAYGTSLTLSNTLVYGNAGQSYGGGLYLTASQNTVTNCVVAGNTLSSTAGYGAGIYCTGNVSLLNTTITGNTIAGSPVSHGGGLYFTGSSLLVNNSIVTGNAPDQAMTNAAAANSVVDNSIIEGGLPVSFSGAGTVAGTVVFTNTADPDGADNRPLTSDDGYSLAASDTGALDLAIGALTTDIVGVNRPQGAAADRGAYERVTGTVTPDTTPPALAITDPTTSPTIISGNYVGFQGTVDAADAIALNWRVDGTNPASGSLPVTANWQINNFSIYFPPGSSLFTITARDAAGNSSSLSRTIIHQTVAMSLIDPDADDIVPDPGKIRFSRLVDSGSDQTFTIAVSGSASASDFVALPTTVTIPAGSLFTDVLVTPIVDGIAEDDELVTVSVTDTGGFTNTGVTSATVRIADNLRFLSLGTIGQGTIDNGGDQDWFSFTATVAADYRIEVQGSSGGIYSLTDPYVVLYGPDSRATEIARDDDSLGGSQPLILQNLNPGTYYVRVSAIGSGSGSYGVLAKIATTTVRIVASDAVAGDIGPDVGQFTISRIGDLSFPVDVNLVYTGAVQSGVDVEALTATVSLATGQASVPILVTPLSDTAVEGDEFLTATIQPSASYQLGNPATATLVVRDEFASTRFVKADATGAGTGVSWVDAFTKLEDALALARTGDQVWIATGTYVPGTTQAARFTVPAKVSVFGGFNGTETARDQRRPLQNLVVLSGEIGTAAITDNSDTVVALGSDSVLDGVTVTAGNGTAPGGAGILVGSSLNVSISNCVVSSNVTTASGGGLYIDTNGGATVINCQFIANSAIGSGGGVSNSSTRSSFSNCVFRGNNAGTGGGLYTGNALVLNSTFNGNTSTSTGAAIYTSDATIRNSILWGSTADQIQVTAAGIIANCIVHGGTISGSATTSAIIDADPLFASSTDLSLLSGSPAIDAADPLFATGTDLLGAIRGPAPDLGAFEAGSTPPVTPDSIPPTVTITSPTTDPVLIQGSGAVSVAGTASDNTGVVSVSWSLSGATTGSGVAAGLTNWSTGQLALNPGTSFVTITVRDAVGNSGTDRIQVDVVKVTLALVDGLVGENGGNTGAVRISRTGSTSATLAVNLAWVGGSGLVVGTDVAIPPSTVTIPVGASTTNVVIAALADGVPETTDESLTVSLTTSPDYQIGVPSTQVLWVVDDTPASLTVGAAPVSGSIDFAADVDRFSFYAAVPGTYQILMDGNSSAAGTLPNPYLEVYGPDDPSYFVGSADYGGTGYYDALLQVDLTAGTYVVRVRDASNTSIGTYKMSVKLVGTRVSVAVGDGFSVEGTSDDASFVISRTGDFSNSVNVLFAVTGTALSGTDYSAIGGSVLIPANAGSTTVVVDALADADAQEDDESVTLTIATSANYAIGTASATVWIQDENKILVEGTPASRTINRGSDTDRFTFVVDGTNAGPKAFQLIRAGGSPLSNGTLALYAPSGAYVTQVTAYGADARFGYSLTAGTWELRASGYYTGETGTYQVLVTPNAPPVANAASYTINEGSVLTGTLTGSDPESAPLTFQGTYYYYTYRGSLTVNSDGTFTYTPYTYANGTDTFQFTVSDGILTSAPATVTIQVNPVNQPPQGSDASFSVLSGSSYFGQLYAYDPDGETVLRSIVTAPTKGTVTITSAGYGSFTYAATPGQSGTDTFQYQLADSVTTAGPFTVTVHIDRRPVIDISGIGTLVTNEDTAVSATLVGSDPDGDPVTFRANNGSKGSVSLNGSTGQFTYTPYLNLNGSDTFTVWANDGFFDSNAAQISVNITPVNDSPTTNSTDNLTIAPPGTTVTGQLVATDPEGDPVTFILVSPPGTGTFDLQPDGRFTYTPPATSGGLAAGPPVTFTYVVQDSSGAQGAVQTYTIRFNSAPTVTPQSITVNEDGDFSGVISATDPENDATTIRISILASHGIAAVTNAAAGSFTYGPSANYSGSDSFVVVANDGTFDSVPETISVTVTPVNDAPIATNSSLSAPPSGSINGALSATDPEGDAMTFTVLSQLVHGSFTAFDANTGAFTYQTTSGLGAVESIAFQAADGSLTSNTAVVTIYINNAPTITAAGGTTAEDTTFNGTISASDADGDALTFQGSLLSGSGTVTVDPTTGNWTYAPSTNSTSTASITLSVSDGKTSVSTTVSVSITPSQDAPVVSAAVVTTAMTAVDRGDSNNPGNLVSSLLAGVQSGTVTDPDGDPLGIAITSADLSKGTWQFTLDGSLWQDFPVVSTGSALLLSGDAVTRIRMRPYVTASGPLAQAVQALAWDGTAGAAGSTTSAQTAGGASAFSENRIDVSILVNAVSAPPTADDNVLTVNEDQSGSVTLTGSDVDGDPLSFSLVGLPVHGTAVLAVDQVTYTPFPQYAGSDLFTFQISAGGQLSNSATVSVTVVAVNDPPVVTPASVTTAEDTPVSGAGSATDIDSSPVFTWAVSTQGSLGTLVINSTDGSFTYTPNPNASGTDTIQITATDDGGAVSAPASVTITITAVNDAPNVNSALSLVLPASSGTSNGLTVTALLATAAGAVTDIDPGAMLGLAVTSTDTSLGTFEYSLDGTTWLAVPTVSATAALLVPVDGVSRLRVQSAVGTGTRTNAFAFRGWDQTSGTKGTLVDATINGGTSAFSSAVGTGSLNINGAPSLVVQSGLTAVATQKFEVIVGSTDPDGDTVTLALATGGPPWLSAVAIAGGGLRVSGVPPLAAVGVANAGFDLSDGVNPTVRVVVPIDVLSPTSTTVSLPPLTLSPADATVFNAIGCSTPEGIASIRAALAGRPRDEARAFAWDVSTQSYVELPAEPVGGLTPFSGIFLASRIGLPINLSGTPQAPGVRITLVPRWTLFAVPPIRLAAGDVAAFAWSGIQVIDDNGNVLDDPSKIAILGNPVVGTPETTRPWSWQAGSYVQVDTLEAGRGYWLKNNGAQNYHLVVDGGPLPPAPFVTARAVVDRGVPPPPPATTASAAPAASSGCGLGSGAGVLLGLLLLAMRFRLRR